MQHDDLPTLRLLHLIGARLPGWHPQTCSGYENCCNCEDCTSRADRVEQVMRANPLMDAGEAARSLTAAPVGPRQPWAAAEIPEAA